MKDTRDLIEQREELKQQVLDSHNETFFDQAVDDYEDIDFEEVTNEWKEDWLDAIALIGEIDVVEDTVGDEFEYGVTLIEESEFEEYVEDFLEDCGYIPKDFPSWIVIDWTETADNVKQDYSELEFDGVTYLYRS